MPRRQRQRMRSSSPIAATELDGAAHQQFADVPDRLRRIESLGTDVDAIHDRVAAEQPVRIFQIVQPLAGRLVPAVGQESICLQQCRRARRTCPDSTRTTDTRSSSTRTECIRTARSSSARSAGVCRRSLSGGGSSLMRYGLTEWYCLKNCDMSTIRSRITGSPGSGRISTGCLRSASVRDAGQAVLAVDVHRIRSAYALAARAAQRQRVVLCLDADQRIEQHALGRLQLDVVVLHVRLVVLVGIVAVDSKCMFSEGGVRPGWHVRLVTHQQIDLRHSARSNTFSPSAQMALPSAASSARACNRADCRPCTTACA